MSLEQALDLIKELKEYEKTHKLSYYEPYDFQKRFHFAKGTGEFVPVPSDVYKEGLAVHRALMCANQVGKTYCGAMETAMHATGIYPKDWHGHRTERPVNILVGSNTNETARDICQKELFGDPTDENSLGTGTVPKDLIGTTSRKPGVPNAFDSVLVKHISGGWSKINFRAYEQGPKKFMGHRYNVAWLDEEPDQEIWSQVLRSMFATDGFAYLTFTPEEGVTEVVNGFMNDAKPGQALIQAGWEDAKHMTPDKIKQKLESIPSHEREMRTKGIPLMGSGLVYPVKEDDYVIPPFEIPAHWPRIAGFDIGWDHPTACVWIAWDRDTDTTYAYDEYRESQARFPVVADAIKRRGDWIPVAWPHDGLMHDKASGKPLADIYRDEYGINMHRDPFSNPPQVGKDEGTGGQGVEVGIQEILNRLETGRHKVFSNCVALQEERRMYHRKDGKVVKLRDDLMSAERYGLQMLRHAITPVVHVPKRKTRPGLTNW